MPHEPFECFVAMRSQRSQHLCCRSSTQYATFLGIRVIKNTLQNGNYHTQQSGQSRRGRSGAGGGAAGTGDGCATPPSHSFLWWNLTPDGPLSVPRLARPWSPDIHSPHSSSGWFAGVPEAPIRRNSYCDSQSAPARGGHIYRFQHGSLWGGAFSSHPVLSEHFMVRCGVFPC